MAGWRYALSAAITDMSAAKTSLEFSSRLESLTDSRQRRLTAFHPTCHRRINELMGLSPAVEDLADSFPALLFALATDFGTQEQRNRSLAMVAVGAPLRSIANALGVAWWLRKLPPSTFTVPLPAFPTDPEFALRVSNTIPTEPSFLPIWLARVGYAYDACGPAFSLWLARHHDLSITSEELVILMAAWAWFSGKMELPGCRLIRSPWHPNMSYRRARDELGVWHQRARLAELLGHGLETPSLAEGSALGHTFTALRTVEDFLAESDALDNCLDRYADHLLSNAAAIFSIRKGVRRVGCVEIGLHPAEVSMPAIMQLKGARNRQAPAEVWQATFAWLGSQDLKGFPPHSSKRTFRSEARKSLWAPYLEFLSGTRHEKTFRRWLSGRVRRRAMGRPGGPRRIRCDAA
jgi:hypothetical protein